MTKNRTVEIQAVASSTVASSSTWDGPNMAKRRETAAGSSVPRGEAIRIALSILTRAERERLTLAENEARRGIQWEDE